MTNTTAIETKPMPLSLQWQKLQQEEPGIRIRNAAQTLGVSELELLLTRLGDGVCLLRRQFAELLKDLEQIGPVMALTRNEQVVHERHGIYTDFKTNKAGNMGICLGDIDLRTFFKHWAVACAVNEGRDDLPRRSIQFFDIEGTAIHKVYLTEATDAVRWEALVDKYLEPEIPGPFVPELIPGQNYPNAGQVSAQDVRQPWAELKDVHHFQALLKRLGIDRLEALELVGSAYAQRIGKNAIEQVLELAARDHLNIMVFVGNGNIVQIHTGEVHKLRRTGPWFNVLDPTFNLHINTQDITQVWSVKRPTSDGIVTSVECFNARRELVLTFFGARKPGQAELPAWQQLVASLERLP